MDLNEELDRIEDARIAIELIRNADEFYVVAVTNNHVQQRAYMEGAALLSHVTHSVNRSYIRHFVEEQDDADSK